MTKKMSRALRKHEFGVAALNISWVEENSIKDSEEESDSVSIRSSLGTVREEKESKELTNPPSPTVFKMESKENVLSKTETKINL